MTNLKPYMLIELYLNPGLCDPETSALVATMCFLYMQLCAIPISRARRKRCLQNKKVIYISLCYASFLASPSRIPLLYGITSQNTQQTCPHITITTPALSRFLFLTAVSNPGLGWLPSLSCACSIIPPGLWFLFQSHCTVSVRTTIECHSIPGNTVTF